jgi:fibronectin-binding autotransporter adhesin
MTLSTFVRLPHCTLLAALAAAGLATAPIHAADILWNGSTDNAWNVGSNWDGGVAPGASDIAAFYADGALNLSTTMGAGRDVDGIAFNAGATNSVTINVSNTNFLRLDAGAAIDISVQTGTHTIQGEGIGPGAGSEFRPTGTQVWNVADGATLSINARIGNTNLSSTSTYNKTGAGTVVLGGNNSGSGGWNFTGGGFTVSEGILRMTANAVGNSGNDYTVSSGATLQLSGANYQGPGGDLTLNGDGVGGVGALHLLSGNQSVQSGVGTVVLASNTSIGAVASTTLNIQQDISGTGSLTKVGAGTVTLTSADASTYSGGTIVSDGTLTTTNALSLGTGAVTVNGGNLSPGGASVGSITLGSGADFLMSSGTLSLDLGITFDQIIGGGAGTFTFGGGTFALTNTAVGDYAIFSGFSSGTVSQQPIFTGAEGFIVSLADTGILTVAVPEPAHYALGVGVFLASVIILRRRRLAAAR